MRNAGLFLISMVEMTLATCEIVGVMGVSELLEALSEHWPRPSSVYEYNANNCSYITLVWVICGSGS